jgi:hypothetical protein
MPHLHIDRVHSFAIIREIGERLSTSLRESDELLMSLKENLQRLREAEKSSREE